MRAVVSVAEIVVRIENLEHVLSKLNPELYLPAIAELLKNAALLGEREAKGLAPKDTSALARSIVGQVTGPLTATVSSPLQYAAVMEEGRSAGARMPPPDALVGWARRHGFSGSTFVLARAIGRRGIKGRFFMRAAMQTVAEQLPVLAEAAVAKIAARWAE